MRALALVLLMTFGIGPEAAAEPSIDPPRRGHIAVSDGLEVIGKASAPDGEQASAERFTLCEAVCIVVDGLGRRVTERTFAALQPFDRDIAIFGEQDEVGAVDRAGNIILKSRHSGLYVLDRRFIVADDHSPRHKRISSLYDFTGRRLFRSEGAAVIFGTWSNHVFYQDDDCAGSNRACPAVFLDDRGNQVARFASFEPGENGEPFARVSLGERQHGYIDATLAFVVPPIYRYTYPFVGGLALVGLPERPQSVIDRTGRMVVPPGRYDSLFLWSNKLFVTAFKPGDHNCPVFIRPDGNELPMKKGFCADSDDPLSAFGYALVRDSRRRYGSIDAKGRRLISPRYKSLSALNAKFLVFDDDRKQPTVHGVVRANGKLLFRISSARIQTIGAGASPAVLRDLFVARSSDGAGLLDAKGIWRVPPIYHDVTVLSADLIALEQQAGEHRFVDGNGNFLPLTGRYFGLRDPVSGAFWLEQCSAEQKADVHNLSCPRGLVNRFGQIIVAARFDAIENAGNGLWHVGIYRRAQMLWGVYDSDGVERIAPAFAELDKEAGRARTVATTASYRQVLIDAHGNILARAVEQ